jgi:hypothetical protein
VVVVSSAMVDVVDVVPVPVPGPDERAVVVVAASTVVVDSTTGAEPGGI